MKALVFDKNGLENLKLIEYKEPEVGPHDVLIRVKLAGLNPIDYFTVSFMKVNPIPHIPGVEFSGEVAKVGEHVKKVKVGDKVTIYGRLFDGDCDMCVAGYEVLCRNGGRIGVDTNGGFAEFVAVEEKYIYKIPEGISQEIASSLTVAALTAYHALKEANLKPNETCVIFGASGNTGMFAIQLAKKFGAKVIAITRKQWLKEFGADYIVDYNQAVEKILQYTNGKGADVIINSLGEKYWDIGLAIAGNRARIVTFGSLLGAEVKININQIYNKHISILGVNRGNRKDFIELLELSKELKVKVWKTFELKEGVDALKALFSENRDGRIFLKIQ